MRLFLQVFSGNCLNSRVLLVTSVNQFRKAHDDTAGVEVVIQRLALAQELRRKQQVEFLSGKGRSGAELLCILHVQAAAVTHRNGTLDHHHRIRVYFQYQVNHLFHVRRIKIILHRVVVGRSGNHHEIRIPVS